MIHPFQTVKGRILPLVIDDVNTDVIIPIARCSISPDAMGQYAFEPLRYDHEGSPIANFPFNQRIYENARILLAGSNFGCGSSREPAVWALAAAGIKVVIAQSFGGIFEANCFRNGILAIALDSSLVLKLETFANQRNAADCEVDLVNQQIRFGQEAITFSVEPTRRKALLEGLDRTEETLLMLDVIQAFRASDEQRRPWIYANLPASSPHAEGDRHV